MSHQRLPSVYLPHGAGPCFFMDWPPAGTWDHMESWLRNLIHQVGRRPRALLVISAHWETPEFSVNAQAAPGLLYDYYGFPAHTYQLEWPAPGNPQLANRIQDLLGAAGIPCVQDHKRGLDHGVFIPLKLAVPEADIPVVQLSLRAGLDPAEHLALGKALAPLRDEDVLIVGSGMSFHNMQRLRQGGSQPDPDSVLFDGWLAETVALPQDEREKRLAHWDRAPGGRASHPVEEHLLPLHVVAGAGGADPGLKVFEDKVMGSLQSAFMFGAVPASS
ncbi:DODA-type extradiol aromatic ring-opening family dioxygenase [Marinobacterium rhizophilum]|uniref:DODA-type extradiol aromatic ring-opening family dioxygenase n=1 Tax=Marinobacterium rhizophilum TaxID=420402 RepID=UPI00035E6DEC|nr:class III extradiol ring-cleavage dioxygenase [Marinobacterium rhizophilum]